MNPLPLIGLLVLPSAGVAVSVAGAIVLAWLVWILADPNANCALDLVLQDLGLQTIPEVPADWMRQIREKARSRIALIVLLSVVEVGSLVLLVLDSFSPDTGASLPAIAGLMLVSATWLAVLRFRERLSFAGSLLRLRCQCHRLGRLAEELRSRWPQRDGQLPIIGRYTCDTSCPDMLTLAVDDQCPMGPQFGPLVRRRPDGSFCLDLMTTPEWKLELFRNGARPASFDDVFEKFAIHNELKTTIQLDRATFISKYDSSFQVATPDEAVYVNNMVKEIAAGMGLGSQKIHAADG